MQQRREAGHARDVAAPGRGEPQLGSKLSRKVATPRSRNDRSLSASGAHGYPGPPGAGDERAAAAVREPGPLEPEPRRNRRVLPGERPPAPEFLPPARDVLLGERREPRVRGGEVDADGVPGGRVRAVRAGEPEASAHHPRSRRGVHPESSQLRQKTDRQRERREPHAEEFPLLLAQTEPPVQRGRPRGQSAVIGCRRPPSQSVEQVRLVPQLNGAAPAVALFVRLPILSLPATSPSSLTASTGSSRANLFKENLRETSKEKFRGPKIPRNSPADRIEWPARGFCRELKRSTVPLGRRSTDVYKDVEAADDSFLLHPLNNSNYFH